MITIQTITETYPDTYSVMNGEYDIICYVNRSPTANCQVLTIGGVADILNHDENVVDVLREVRDRFDKPLILMDINAYNEEEALKDIPPEAIVFKQRYDSTNGSEMIMFLINTNYI